MVLRVSACSRPARSSPDSSSTTVGPTPEPAGRLSEPTFSSTEVKLYPRGCFCHVCLTTLSFPQTEISRSSDGMASSWLSQQGRSSGSLSLTTTEVVSSVSNSTRRSRLPVFTNLGSVGIPVNLVPPHLFQSKSTLKKKKKKSEPFFSFPPVL